MFNDSLIYFGIKHRVERCSPCPQEICRLQKVRFIPASQVNIHTKLFNKIFILGWLHLSHRNLAIFCLFLLKDYSLFDMHGMGDSSPTIPSEKDYCLLTMVLTTAVSSGQHLQGPPQQQRSPTWGHTIPGAAHIQKLTSGGLPKYSHVDALRDKSDRPHVLQGSPRAWPKFVGLASKFDFSLCSVVLLEPSFPRFWF